MIKKVIIIAAKGFEEIELVTVFDILRRASIKVTLAGLNHKQIQGSRGLNILTDITLDKIKKNFDACILPGGLLGAKNLAKSELVSSFIKRMYQDNKIIAAICASPALVLAPLGILENKTITCYPEFKNNLIDNIIYKNQDVVVDQNIITSQGVATTINFALTIVEKLLGKDLVNRIKEAILLS